MDLVNRVTSKLTVRPNSQTELHQEPCINNNGYINFTPNDPENPRNWSPARKWYITITIIFITLNGLMASTITAATTDSIMEEFGISRTVAQLTITLFLMGFCIGPLLFAPLSEFYGRRWILYVTFILYFCFTYLTTWPPNFEGLLVGRFLTGSFIAASAAIAPSVLVDIWDDIERDWAIAILTCISWTGPALGIVISGFVQLKKDWRWGLYICLWLGAFSIPLLLTIPETHQDILLTQKARQARQLGNEIQSKSEASRPNLLHIYKTALIRPWAMFFDLVAFLCCLYFFTIYTLQYMLFSIYPIIFHDMRGWNIGTSQLPILGQAIGAVIGTFIMLADINHRKKKAVLGTESSPEYWMGLAKIGGIGFPMFMLWLSWSAQYNSVHWIIPTIGGTLLTTCLTLICFAYLNYMTEVYLEYAASVMAASTIARCIGGAGAPLFTTQMFSTLGIGGGGSLIAGIAAVLAIIPFLFYRYGLVIRSKSRYARA